MPDQTFESKIKQQIEARLESDIDMLRRRIVVDDYTPSGRPRSAPVYVATIMNTTLGKSRTVKDKTFEGVRFTAENQLRAWAELELKALITQARKDAKEAAAEAAEEASRRAIEYLEELKNILNYTLSFDDRIDWASLEDHREFPAFRFSNAPMKSAPPVQPTIPKKPFFAFLIPAIARKWETNRTSIIKMHEEALTQHDLHHEATVNKWRIEKETAAKEYEKERDKFLALQEKRNRSVASYQKRFEQGDPDAIVEYINAVFERSNYPEGIAREYVSAYDSSAKTLVVNVSLPNQDSIPDVIEYKFVAKTGECKPISMKKKEHDELYDDIIKQIIIRTIHEVFESIYTKHVMTVVVNGWVTYLDKATGNDQTSCIISVSADREKFETFNLTRIDHSECIKSLKGLIAGPLSGVAPVKPIMQLNTADDRFIEARSVLAEVNATTNLAEMPWEDFEHLVRDLFGEMFSGEGSEVHVTQASRDQGVDAIAFDPDPIRGGKFVIQAKRYTKTVGVAAVRELYGTMINEGAVKGILVTTATFGRDSRQFVVDKPITLIDGSNLVYLLEQYGHKVRIDVGSVKRG